MDNLSKNKPLAIAMPERIDAENAEAFRDQVLSLVRESGDTLVILKGEDLKYISSAGLRTLLYLHRHLSGMFVTGVSQEVYNILEMTGFTEILPIEKAPRCLSIEGCPLIGTGAKADVYRYDAETVIKVYHRANALPAIRQERELARKAFILGLPTAISYDVVRVGDRYGSVFELLDADSLSTEIREHPEKFEEYVRLFADLLRDIHAVRVAPGDMPDIRLLIGQWVTADESYLEAEDYGKLCRLIEEVPVSHTLIHGDYHTGNVLLQKKEALLIDMDTLSYGHPVFELANVYLALVGFGELAPDYVEHFIGLPYETTCRIWQRFLPLYLQSSDPDLLKDVEEKTRLLSYVRLLRHTVRRDTESEKARETIALCRDRISGLLKTIDSLTW